jgi:hypothetical protein
MISLYSEWEGGPMLFKSGKMKILNAKTGEVEDVRIGEGRVTDREFVLDPFTLQGVERERRYAFQGQGINSHYRGRWTCADGRSGTLNDCRYEDDALTITGVMVEANFDHHFKIEIDEE